VWAQALTTIAAIPFVPADLDRTDFDPGCRDVLTIDLEFVIVTNSKIAGKVRAAVGVEEKV
jgi:hypothetical protein